MNCVEQSKTQEYTASAGTSQRVAPAHDTVSADCDSRHLVCVQYGCGWSAPAKWHNYDASPTLLFERVPLFGQFYTKNAARFPANVRYGDIVKGLPYAEGTVDCVYASHVLEHLSRAQCLQALHNTYRMLKPGGTFRLVVPDLQWRATAYLEALSAGNRQAAMMFLRSTCLGIEKRGRGPLTWLKTLFGHSAHLWMWDEPSLTDALCETGFQSVRRCRFGDAEDAVFTLVEDQGRFFDEGRAELALEAKK